MKSNSGVGTHILIFSVSTIIAAYIVDMFVGSFINIFKLENSFLLVLLITFISFILLIFFIRKLILLPYFLIASLILHDNYKTDNPLGEKDILLSTSVIMSIFIVQRVTTLSR